MTLENVRFRARLAFLVVGLLASPLVSAAATVTVPGNYSTIQAAINAVIAGSLPDGTTINVQAGNYPETLSVGSTGKSLTVRGVSGAGATFVDATGKGMAAVNVLNATGQVVFQGLTFRHGDVPGGTSGGGFVISGASPSFFDCIFELNSAFNGGGGTLIASNATFTGCTIRNNTARHFGGGVFMVQGSHPVFTNCDITGNASGTATSDGAGGGVSAIDASPTFRGSHINGNTSKFAAGGIFHQGAFGSPYGRSMLLIEDTEVADNVSTSPSGNPAEGGGVHVEDNATGTLTRARILRNHAGTGGGLNAYRGRYDIVDSVIDANQALVNFGGGIAASSNYATPQMPGSIINLTTTLVRNNTAPLAGGIGVIGDNFSSEKAKLSLTGSVVSGNQSQSQGGGILASLTILTVTNSMIIRNSVSGTASDAVGGGLDLTTSSSATITGTTIANNTAGSFGGGIFVFDGSNTLNMSGSNVYENTAGMRGGGLFIGGASQSGTIQSSTIADNHGSAQINEEGCTSVSYQNNTITATKFSGCAIGARETGTLSGPPRFEHFLAVPSAGASSTLAWSVARATTVTISGVGTWTSPDKIPSGTVDVTPTSSTTYSLTATATSPNGGNYGAVTTGFTSVQPPPPPPPPRTGRIVDGDFDGDGKADITVFRPSNGTWFTRYSGTGSATGVQWGNGNDVPVPRDYDGDGKTDIAIFRPSNGTWFIQYSGTGIAVGIQWGNGNDVPVPGDYDGDGKADIAIFRPSSGTWFIVYSSTGTAAGVQWGNGNDLPVPGDYDGDGKTDIAIFRPSSGTWFIVYSSTGTAAGIQWGNGNDVPVPGDYDGDGKTDIAIFRPSTGTWFLQYSGTGTAAGIQWGNGNDVPVPGDFDGDGKTDIAIFRPSTGTWFLQYSSTGTAAGLQWGNGLDIPILKRP